MAARARHGQHKTSECSTRNNTREDLKMLDENNEEIEKSGGTWLKLNEKGQNVRGAMVSGEVREKKTPEGQTVLSSRTGKPRKEWVLTLEVDGELKNAVASEGGQIAIRKAVQALGRKLQPGDIIDITVSESSVPGKKGAEWDVKIEPGTGSPVEDDKPPF